MSVTVGRAALAAVDLIIAQGADNAFTFRYSRDVDGVRTPIDLTGYTARAQIRRSVGGEVYLDLTDIVLGSDGTIQMSIGHAVTEDSVWNNRSSGVWDMELTDTAGGVIRFASGAVQVKPDMTRNVN